MKRKEVTLRRESRGGYFPTCDYYECTNKPRHKIPTMVGYRPRFNLACDEHAQFFKDCEDSFAEIRAGLADEYGWGDTCTWNAPHGLNATDYGKLRDGGKKCLPRSA